MINKVKPPSALRLVPSSHETKNQLGGQSGESYSPDSADPNAAESEPKSKKVSAPTDPEAVAQAGKIPAPDLIHEQVGLTTVVKEWLEESKGNNPISASRASTRYQGDSAPAKGMLLNKKIS